jgi:D-amino-acid dehydrogenase
MRVAVVGAGIVGVTLAHELAASGHEVQVLERRASVAAEGSFARAGLLAPRLVRPWTATPLGGPPRAPGAQPALPWLQAASLPHLRWLWQGWRSRRGSEGQTRRAALQALAHASQGLQQRLADALAPSFEHTQGVMLLVREAAHARRLRAALPDADGDAAAARWLEAADARALEPALNPTAPLAGALHLPRDGAGNCRQFAHALKGEAQRLGVRWRFGAEVLRLRPGKPVTVELAAQDALTVDAVVLCTGLDSAALLQPLGLRLPLRAVRNASFTAPLRGPDDSDPAAPRATVIDLARQVALTRLGDRVRASGGASLGTAVGRVPQALLQCLHGTLEHWFAGAAALRLGQAWLSASPTLPDGLPVLGASGHDGVWLNIGHGAHGWVLASGAAALLRAGLEGAPPPLPLQPFAADRFR